MAPATATATTRRRRPSAFPFLLLLLLPTLLHAFLRPSTRPPTHRSFLPSALEALTLRVTSANVLAPIFKRVDANGTRESDFEETFLARHNKILDSLVKDKPPHPPTHPPT